MGQLNPRSRTVLLRVLPLALLSVVTAAYLLTFFNRFSGLRTGNGEFTSGIGLLRGVLPYRDYFTATPPLNVLKSACLLAVFGKTLFVSRLAGVIERIGLALLLYGWLRKLAGVRSAFFAALATIIIATGDRTDPIASYNHDAILFAMLCGYAASFLFDGVLSELSPRRILSFGMLSGFFAGLSLLTKQTVGLGIFTAVLCLVAALLLRTAPWLKALQWIAAYLAGCALPVGVFFLWLAHIGSVQTFLQMVFLAGPKAKAGSPGAFFVRMAHVAVSDPEWSCLGLAAALLSGLALYRWLFRPTNASVQSRQTAKHIGLIAAVALLLLAAAMVLSHTAIPVAHGFTKAAVYFVQFALTVWFAVAVVDSLRRTPTPRTCHFILLAGVGWSVAMMLALSWPAFEPMTLPGLGLLLICVLEEARPRGFAFTALILAVMVFFQMREKLDVPFSFDRIDDPPVRLATVVSAQPELRHMRLAPEMAALLDGSVELIRAHSTPQDTIYAYPGMELIYTLADRGYPTVTNSPNIDVVNDAFAAQEAERLLRARPAVILYYRPDPADMQEDDRIWRDGRPSGQHTLVAALDALTSGYTLAASYPIYPKGRPVQVYLRPASVNESADVH